jgi:hypothetical protein
MGSRRTRRWAALLAIALLTAPTVLPFGLIPWVFWLAAAGDAGWRAAVAAGCLLAAATCVLFGRWEGYFRLRPFEASGRAYERLGVRAFRHFVVSGDSFNRAAARYDPTHVGVRSWADVDRAEQTGRWSERVHAAGLLFVLPPARWAVACGEFALAAALLGADVACNLYPLLLQRYTRGRLAALQDRRRDRAGCRGDR